MRGDHPDGRVDLEQIHDLLDSRGRLENRVQEFQSPSTAVDAVLALLRVHFRNGVVAADQPGSHNLQSGTPVPPAIRDHDDLRGWVLSLDAWDGGLGSTLGHSHDQVECHGKPGQTVADVGPQLWVVDMSQHHDRGGPGQRHVPW